jgi:hypothetical protein
MTSILLFPGQRKAILTGVQQRTRAIAAARSTRFGGHTPPILSCSSSPSSESNDSRLLLVRDTEPIDELNGVLDDDTGFLELACIEIQVRKHRMHTSNKLTVFGVSLTGWNKSNSVLNNRAILSPLIDVAR